jgi:hypothetical protein
VHLQAQKRESRGAVVTVVKLEDFELPSICARSFFNDTSLSSLDNWYVHAYHVYHVFLWIVQYVCSCIINNIVLQQSCACLFNNYINAVKRKTIAAAASG